MCDIRPFSEIKTEEIPIFFASGEKKPFKRVLDGAYCPITYDAYCLIKLSNRPFALRGHVTSFCENESYMIFSSKNE